MGTTKGGKSILINSQKDLFEPPNKFGRKFQGRSCINGFLAAGLILDLFIRANMEWKTNYCALFFFKLCVVKSLNCTGAYSVEP